MQAEAGEVLGPRPRAGQHRVGQRRGRGAALRRRDRGDGRPGDGRPGDPEQAPLDRLAAAHRGEHLVGRVGVEVADQQRRRPAERGAGEAVAALADHHAGREGGPDAERDHHVLQAVAVDVADHDPGGALRVEPVRLRRPREVGHLHDRVAAAADDVDPGRFALWFAGRPRLLAGRRLVLGEHQQGLAVGRAQARHPGHVPEAAAGGDPQLAVRRGLEDPDVVGAPGPDRRGQLLVAVAVEVTRHEGVDVAVGRVGGQVGQAPLPHARGVGIEAIQLAGIGGGADVELAHAVAVEVSRGAGAGAVLGPAQQLARPGVAELDEAHLVDRRVRVADQVGGPAGDAHERSGVRVGGV